MYFIPVVILTFGYPSVESLTFLWATPYLADMWVDWCRTYCLQCLTLRWVYLSLRAIFQQSQWWTYRALQQHWAINQWRYFRSKTNDGDDGWRDVQNRPSGVQTNTSLLQEPDITENVVCFALGEGNRPLGIFMGKESEFLFTLLYFHLLWTNQRWQQKTKKQHLYLGWGKLFYKCLGRSVHCDPRVLNPYHTIFTCNFATLAILDICLCNMCATNANK